MNTGLGSSKSSLGWPLESQAVLACAHQRGQPNHRAFRRRSSRVALGRLQPVGTTCPAVNSAAGKSALCQFSHFQRPGRCQRRRSIGIVYLMRFALAMAKCSTSTIAPNPALNRTRRKRRCSFNIELLHHRHARRLSLRWASRVVKEI